MPPLTQGMLPPDEWRKRTALTLSRRSPSTLAVDAAYDEYFKLRSDKNAEKLYFILEKYMREHGGDWTKSERNKASGGLMKVVHELAREHAHPGLGKPKFNDSEVAALAHWKEQRELIAERFFRNCTLDVKPSLAAVKIPWGPRTGIRTTELVKTAKDAWSIADSIKMVDKIVQKAVDPVVASEVTAHILKEVIPEFLKETATSILPFKNVLTSGGSAIGNGIMACVDVYRRSEADSHQHVLATGSPQAAFSSMIMILEREKSRHLITAGTSALKAGAAAVSQVLDPTHVSQVAISAGFAIAALTQRIFLIGRDFLERSRANKALIRPSAIDASIFETHPILGCYLLLGAEMSTLIAFFANFGNRGWMSEVESAVKLHLSPLQELAGVYVDDSRFHLVRSGEPVYLLPGTWKQLKKWKNGRWETGGVNHDGIGSQINA